MDPRSRKLANLARAHMSSTIITPAKLANDRESAVVIRYDGVMKDGVPVVYAVVPDVDLVKLPTTVFNGLDLVVQKPDGNLKGSNNVFFIRSAESMNLYVDTEVHPGFIQSIKDSAEKAGLSVWHGHGDIVNMIGPGGDIQPSSVPAYIANGSSRVPVKAAHEHITAMRVERKMRGSQAQLEAKEALSGTTILDVFNDETPRLDPPGMLS